MPRAKLSSTAEFDEHAYLNLSDQRVLGHAEWASAECREAPADVFFPISVRDTRSRDIAVSFCQRCPIVDACLEIALKDRSLVGIWGGTDEDERHQVRRHGLPRAGRTTR